MQIYAATLDEQGHDWYQVDDIKSIATPPPLLSIMNICAEDY